MVGTMPYINYSALANANNYPKEDVKHITHYTPKYNDNIIVQLKNNKTISGKFGGYWEEDNEDGIFVDNQPISDSEIISIEQDINMSINEVLKIAGVM